MSAARRALLAATLALAACGGPDLLRFELVPGDCNLSALQSVDSVQVRLDGPAGSASSECIKVSPASLQDVQRALSGKAAFPAQQAGPHTVTVSGFDSSSCKDPRLLCVRARFTLPPSGDSLALPAHCYEGSSPPPAFAACTSPP